MLLYILKTHIPIDPASAGSADGSSFVNEWHEAFQGKSITHFINTTVWGLPGQPVPTYYLAQRAGCPNAIAVAIQPSGEGFLPQVLHLLAQAFSEDDRGLMIIGSPTERGDWNLIGCLLTRCDDYFQGLRSWQIVFSSPAGTPVSTHKRKGRFGGNIIGGITPNGCEPLIRLALGEDPTASVYLGGFGGDSQTVEVRIVRSQ